MSDTENPPVDPADPPTTQGGGTNANEPGGSSPDPESPDARSADPPTTQGGGG